MVTMIAVILLTSHFSDGLIVPSEVPKICLELSNRKAAREKINLTI